jgi:hypothetical protein
VSPKLKRRLNAQLQWIVANAAQRIRPGPTRMAVVWTACKEMFDRAMTNEERTFWRNYLAELELRADELKAEKEKRERALN